ncbi:unnamed protein product [Sphagnum jensenii]|uniref:Uncharacterized protein n=1 Tax=Sphagnum jensenii TaxID=128206 RepID=A0ABP1BDP3_9BRYO
MQEKNTDARREEQRTRNKTRARNTIKCVGSTARRSGRRDYYCPILESTCSLSAKRRLLLAEHYLPDQSSIGYG